ncbi:MAG: dTDP-glucose 4,6-dehydratase [Bacteroidetes bacterium CG12_big_fil_rev_8_21_14_0_65_60_17]|nr:MAG: dTDP-glucose 4,6-dehydratase [Bacteroidetes bacterium CG12_big_fil_rev_8_21_14_0_65_60_17]
MPVFRPHCVLVTGGAGFIGSNYLHHMVRTYPDVRFITVDALTYAGNRANLAGVEERDNFRFIHADITSEDTMAQLFEAEPIDAVVHFAAESHVDRSIASARDFVHTNVEGTRVLLDAARRAWVAAPAGKRRFHHISTDEVFGALGPTGVFTEDSPYAPRSPYAASKAAADHLVRAWMTTHNLPAIITNTSNNYGPFQNPEKLIPLVISRALAKESVPVYGKGEQVRDWLFVKDHVEALERVLMYGQTGRTYLIGGDQEVRNIDLVEHLLDAVDVHLGRPHQSSRQFITFVTDRPGHDFRYALDSSRICDELGWTPRHSLEEGLKKTVSWYLDNTDWIAQAHRKLTPPQS